MLLSHSKVDVVYPFSENQPCTSGPLWNTKRHLGIPWYAMRKMRPKRHRETHWDTMRHYSTFNIMRHHHNTNTHHLEKPSVQASGTKRHLHIPWDTKKMPRDTMKHHEMPLDSVRHCEMYKEHPRFKWLKNMFKNGLYRKFNFQIWMTSLKFQFYIEENRDPNIIMRNYPHLDELITNHSSLEAETSVLPLLQSPGKLHWVLMPSVPLLSVHMLSSSLTGTEPCTLGEGEPVATPMMCISLTWMWGWAACSWVIFCPMQPFLHRLKRTLSQDRSCQSS